MSEIDRITKITDRAGTGAPNFTNGVNFAGSDSGISPHTHTESASEPGSPSNGDTWWDSDNDIYKVYMNNEWKDWLGASAAAASNYGDRLVRVGFAAAKNDIHRLDITTLGNAVDFKDLNRTSANRAGGCSNVTNAYIFNGNGQANGTGSDTNSISYFSISNSTNAADFGDSSVAASAGMACSDATTGCHAIGGVSSIVNTIDKITMATPGNATDFGNLTVARTPYGNSAGSNGTRGIFALGYNGSGGVNTIDYITIANAGNATDFGDHVAASYGSAAGGTGTGDRLIFATFYGYSSKISYVTVSTTGNAADFGNTTITTSAHNFYCGVAANATRCIIQSGGYVGGGASNSIEYVTMATLGNATDFGDQATNEEQSHQVATSGAAS